MRKWVTVALAAACVEFLGMSHIWAETKWENLEKDPYCFTDWKKSTVCKKNKAAGKWDCRYEAYYCAWADTTRAATGYTCSDLYSTQDQMLSLSRHCYGPYR